MSEGTPRIKARSLKRKSAGTGQEVNEGASPVLRGRKRKTSATREQSEPPSKRMADGEILAAINDVGKSVVAMEKQLKNCCTKEDLSAMTKEIKNEVQRNTSRIDQLFEMRKSDAKRVEQLVDKHIKSRKDAEQGFASLSSAEESLQQDYLQSRRSVRLWPILAGNNVEEQVRSFFYQVLSVPSDVSKNVRIESAERIVQPRRSKITGEVLVWFGTAQDRDTIQSYAANLAGIDGKAGLRLDVPDHLRGVFRMFEVHATLLKKRYGSVKRSIKFDDLSQSFCMDVKLETTGWHRIDSTQIRKAFQKNVMNNVQAGETNTEERTAEFKKVLLCNDDGSDSDEPVVIASDDNQSE